MNLSVFFAGMTMGLSLIVGIGAQNAFVLRQGLRNEFVFAVCLACAASDALLIAAGVAGFGKVTSLLPWLDPVMRYGGAGFLVWYGAKSLLSALRSNETLTVGGAAGGRGLAQTLLTCLTFTWLNPHVYLDTVVLLGSISTRFPDREFWFALGAMTGSFLFFFSLGYGAIWLRPLFARPVAWRVLEGIIALVMWVIAFKLVQGV